MLSVYGIHDGPAGMFVGPIMLFPADAAAIRVFEDALRNPSTTIGQHPGDYDLVLLGTFDPETGALYGSENGHGVCVRNGSEVDVGRFDPAQLALEPVP